MKQSMMEDALQVKAKNGVLAAADFLMKNGFPYDLALMALVGLRRANHYYGLEQKNVSSEKRGLPKARRNVITLTRRAA